MGKLHRFILICQGFDDDRLRYILIIICYSDGLTGFKDRVLTPPSLRGATTERRARAEADAFAALRARILKGTT